MRPGIRTALPRRAIRLDDPATVAIETASLVRHDWVCFLHATGIDPADFSAKGGAAMAEGTEPEVSEDDPGVMSSEDAPSKEKGTPSISGEDQDQGKTTHPGPESDVGVGDETD